MNAIFAATTATVSQNTSDDFAADRLHSSILPFVPTETIEPGDTVDVQLGNSFDSYWTPKAKMVVLRVRDGICGTIIVDGVCVRDDGVKSVKLDVVQYNPGEIFKSTRSFYEHEMKRYLEIHTYSELCRLMSQYADEIEALEGYTEIHKTQETTPVNAFASLKDLQKANNKDRVIEDGKVYDAQLGNENDTSGYVETAKILILRNENQQFGETWTAVAKKPCGEAQFLYNVCKYRLIDYKLYCTRALSESKIDRYAEAQPALMRELLARYKAEFDALPAFAYTNGK